MRVRDSHEKRSERKALSDSKREQESERARKSASERVIARNSRRGASE